MKSILYIGDHCILERRRVHLLNSLGFEVLSVASYLDPKRPDPGKTYLAPLDISVNNNLVNEFKFSNPSGYSYGKKLNLTKNFLSNFDVVLCSWIYEPLLNSWDLFKDKVVIYESIGQSDAARETSLHHLRGKGVTVVRMSQSEENFINYAGADAVIDLEVDCDYYTNWSGLDPSILTVNSAIMKRDSVCNTNLYLKVTEGLPKKVYGSHNEDCTYPWCHGSASDAELLSQYQSSRAYFSLGTKPCPVVLSFKEAMSVGCPVITWGPKLGNHAVSKTYSAYTYIDNRVNGFYSDDPRELRNYAEVLLKDHSLAKRISIASRETALKNFSFDVLQEKWKKLFKELGVSI